MKSLACEVWICYFTGLIFLAREVCLGLWNLFLIPTGCFTGLFSGNFCFSTEPFIVHKVRREKQFLRRRAVMFQIFAVALPDVKEAVKLPQQPTISSLLDPPLKAGTRREQLRIATHKHGHTRRAARPDRLPVRFQIPARHDESVKWPLDN